MDSESPKIIGQSSWVRFEENGYAHGVKEFGDERNETIKIGKTENESEAGSELSDWEILHVDAVRGGNIGPNTPALEELHEADDVIFQNDGLGQQFGEQPACGHLPHEQIKPPADSKKEDNCLQPDLHENISEQVHDVNLESKTQQEIVVSSLEPTETAKINDSFNISFKNVVQVSPFDDVPGFNLRQSVKQCTGKLSSDSDHQVTATKEISDLQFNTNDESFESLRGNKVNQVSQQRESKSDIMDGTPGKHTWVKFDEINNKEAPMCGINPHDSGASDVNGKADNSEDQLTLSPKKPQQTLVYSPKELEQSTSQSSTGTPKNWVSFEEQPVNLDNEVNSFRGTAQSKIVTETPSRKTHVSDDSSLHSSPKPTANLLLSETVIPDMFVPVSEEVSSLGPRLTSIELSEKNEVDGLLVPRSKSEKGSDVESSEICNMSDEKTGTLKLFTASAFQISPAKSIVSTNDKIEFSDLQSDLNEEKLEPLDDYPAPTNRKEWVFFYRHPDRKRKIGPRHWIPATFVIKDQSLRISGSVNEMEILKEIPLHPFFVFTLPVLHRKDRRGKVHSVKLQYVKYKETRKMKSKFQVEHTPTYTPVFKIGHEDHHALHDFIDTVDNVVRQIPTYRDKGITYSHEELFIDCDDICQFLLSGKGEILKYNITLQMRLRAFITSNPDLYLFLNDEKYQDKLEKEKEKFPVPQRSHKWIRPENVEFHPCVDKAASDEKGGIVFKPPDGCSFELLRFRVRNTKELPIAVKSSLNVISANSVILSAELKVGGEGKMLKHIRNNVIVRFPIPHTWTPMFVKSRSFSGQKRYVQAKADLRQGTQGLGRTNRCNLQVNAGRSTYEPEYSAIVWRLGDLPYVLSGLPADAVNTFKCELSLPFEVNLPDEFCPYAEVEFEVSNAVGSEISIREVLLSDGRVPDKWVCYRAIYSYKVLLNVLNRGKTLERNIDINEI